MSGRQVQGRERKGTLRIDVHSHYYPAAIAEVLGRHGGQRPYANHPDDLAERFGAMNAAGVDRQILSMGALMPYWPERPNAVAAARELNDVLCEAVAQYPERFGVFGSVPLPHVDDSIAEVGRCLDQLGFEGIALGSGADGSPIDDDRFAALWQELDRRAAVVYLHPGINNQATLRNGVRYPPNVLDAAFGGPGETGRCVVRLVLAGIPQRHPRIRFIVANFGGLLPNAWPHVLHGVAVAGLPDVVEPIRTMWFDTGTITDAQLLAITASYGADRLVLGSDGPYGDLEKTVALLQKSSLLTPEDVERILDHAPAQVLSTEV